MALAYLRQISKLTAVIVVIAAVALSVLIQNINNWRLREDASSLSLVARRHEAGESARYDDVVLGARRWLQENNKELWMKNNDSRALLESQLKSRFNANPTRPKLLWVDTDHAATVIIPLPGKDTVAAMLAAFERAHRPTSITIVSDLDPERIELGNSAMPKELRTLRGLVLALEYPATDRVDLSFREPNRDLIDMSMYDAVNIASVPFTGARLDGPSAAAMVFGPDASADKLAADPRRLRWLDMRYGDLTMSEAQGVVSKLVTASYNSVSVLGVQVPAEYFALAIDISLLAVVGGIVSTLNVARTRGVAELDFSQSDSMFALLLMHRYGRLVLWSVLPVAAAAAAFPVPSEWLFKAHYFGLIGVCTMAWHAAKRALADGGLFRHGAAGGPPVTLP